MFDDRSVRPEQIEQFFIQLGVHLKRQNPFYNELSVKNKLLNIMLLPVSLILTASAYMTDCFIKRRRKAL